MTTSRLRLPPNVLNHQAYSALFPSLFSAVNPIQNPSNLLQHPLRPPRHPPFVLPAIGAKLPKSSCLPLVLRPVGRNPRPPSSRLTIPSNIPRAVNLPLLPVLPPHLWRRMLLRPFLRSLQTAPSTHMSSNSSAFNTARPRRAFE